MNLVCDTINKLFVGCH